MRIICVGLVVLGVWAAAAAAEVADEIKPYESVGDARLAQVTRPAAVKELRLDGKDLTDAGMARLKDFTEVRKVWLEAPKVTKAGVAHLAALTKLEELTVLRCAGVDEDGLESLKGLKNLRVLDLVYIEPVTSKQSAALSALTGLRRLRLGKVGEDGLAGVAKLTDLEDLDLNFSWVNDVNLAHLKGLTRLKKLDVQNTEVTDAGLKHLAGLTGLRTINLQSNKITDDGLKHLAGLTGLEELHITDCKVAGAAFKDMAGMKGLRELWFGGNPITDEHVMALKALPGLKEVILTGTKVSEEAALELKRARPEVRVKDVADTEVSLAEKPARRRPAAEDLSKAAADFTMTATEFQKAFKAGREAAAKQYAGKVIELGGEVGAMGRNMSGDSNISLKADGDPFGVACFTADDEPWAKVVPGQKVKVKGRVPPSGDAMLAACVFTDAGTYAAIELTAADLAKEYAADPEATTKKYDKRHVVLTGEVAKKEYNSAGAVAIVLKTAGDVRVGVSLTAFERDLSRSIKVGQTIKVIGEYTLNYGKEEVKLYFCMPFKQP